LKNEDILGLHELLLDTRWRNEDVIAMTNGSLLRVSGAGSCCSFLFDTPALAA
jgi:hypothetical protein